MLAEWTKCTVTILEESTQEVSENEGAPQSIACLSLTKHKTGKTPLGWVNRKLCVFLRMFSGVSLLDQRSKIWWRGRRDVWKSTSAFWRWRYWSHWWSLKDTTNHNCFNPTSLWSRDHKLKTLGVGDIHASPYIDLWDGHSILNTDAEETPGVSYVRDLYHCCPTPQGTLLYKLNQNLGGNHWEGVSISHPPQFENVKALVYLMEVTLDTRDKMYKC